MKPLDLNCIKLLDASPKSHARACFRSALNHLELAKKLADVDAGMAMFRAITAEEEACSGLMLCLKHMNYGNAEKLQHRNHVHKSAVIPFLSILGDFFGETAIGSGLQPHLHLKDEDGDKRLTIAISVTVNGERGFAYPIPPLNFAVKSGDKSPSYKQQIGRFVAASGASNIVSYIKEQANLRN
jgi:hypothetical protein